MRYRRTVLRWLAPAACLVILGCAVAWVRMLPAAVPSVEGAAVDGWHQFEGDDGRTYNYLGGYDGYHWMRLARNVLQTGSVCDQAVDGECRETYANAPVGVLMLSEGWLHAWAIAAIHRLHLAWSPQVPLSVSAFLLSVVVGVALILPAFGLSRRLCGLFGALLTTALIALEPSFLLRSLRGDTDVWNVFLPLVLLWALLRAEVARSLSVAFGFATLAAGSILAHAAIWRGWPVVTTAALAGLAVASLFRRSAAGGQGARRWILAVLLVAFGLSAWHGIDLDLGFRALMDTEKGWPTPFPFVKELQALSVREVVDGVGGAPVFLGGLVGLVGLLAMGPVGSAVAEDSKPEDGPDTLGVRIALLLWALAALALSLRGRRFLLLLHPPLAIGVGFLFGAVLEHVLRTVRAQQPPRRFFGRLAVALLVSAALAIPFRAAQGRLSSYRPRMNDALWQALAYIGESSPSDTIVATWWDYGHFAKYVADRPVLSDGATLRTRVHYWVARALMSDDAAESLGLLRMLACGSDASWYPEAKRGAFEKLRELGLSASEAEATLMAIARLDEPAASAQLDSMGIVPPEREEILDATHCDPPPVVVILSSAMARIPSWRVMGTASIGQGGAGQGPRPRYLAGGWQGCRFALGTNLTCRFREPVEYGGFVLERFELLSDAPGQSSFEAAGGRRLVPARIRIRDDGVYSPGNPDLPTVGVLVDRGRRRVLLAGDQLLDSLFTRLMVASDAVEGFEAVGSWGQGRREIVRAWRVRF